MINKSHLKYLDVSLFHLNIDSPRAKLLSMIFPVGLYLPRAGAASNEVQSPEGRLGTNSNVLKRKAYAYE